MEQINLFTQLEQENRENRHRKFVRDGYRLWLTTPDIVPYKEELAYLHDTYSGSPIHICDNKPDNVHIWWNRGASIGGEYWVLNERPLAGERIDICPYCKANLKNGEGERFLEKWLRGYTYYQEKSVRDYYDLDEIDKELIMCHG